jgi:sigma-B regulation protein RsbQ
VPTLMIQATNDPAVPLAAATWMTTHLPEARLEVVTAEGHFPHVADPGHVLSLIDDFVFGDTVR